MGLQHLGEIAPLVSLALLMGFAAAFLGLIYRISVSQVIEFDSQRIVVRKDIRGWERKKQYSVEDCSELEWQEGTEDSPAALSCNVGRRTVKLCEQLSEEESIEILAALQLGLPDVAQKICSYPESKEHFITLGLNRQQKS